MEYATRFVYDEVEQAYAKVKDIIGDYNNRDSIAGALSEMNNNTKNYVQVCDAAIYGDLGNQLLLDWDNVCSNFGSFVSQFGDWANILTISGGEYQKFEQQVSGLKEANPLGLTSGGRTDNYVNTSFAAPFTAENFAKISDYDKSLYNLTGAKYTSANIVSNMYKDYKSNYGGIIGALVGPLLPGVGPITGAAVGYAIGENPKGAGIGALVGSLFGPTGTAAGALIGSNPKAAGIGAGIGAVTGLGAATGAIGGTILSDKTKQKDGEYNENMNSGENQDTIRRYDSTTEEAYNATRGNNDSIIISNNVGNGYNVGGYNTNSYNSNVYNYSSLGQQYPDNTQLNASNSVNISNVVYPNYGTSSYYSNNNSYKSNETDDNILNSNNAMYPYMQNYNQSNVIGNEINTNNNINQTTV